MGERDSEQFRRTKDLGLNSVATLMQPRSSSAAAKTGSVWLKSGETGTNLSQD